MLIDDGTISALTIPFFSGIIGYVTNWSGVWMLFYPLEFQGFKIPGLKPFVRFLPKRVRQIPGVMHGGLGWQGIIPSRAAKMGSIAVDKGIAKLGSPREFYQQLEPDKIAAQILQTSERDIHDIVERVMQREHPRLWQQLPPRVRDEVHTRVRAQLPEMVKTVTDDIGENIDQLLDVKVMVIRHIEENPELANRIFLDVGRKELKFIQNFGFYFGFLLGIPTIFILEAFHHWWVLPILGSLVGYATNLLGIHMIFEPKTQKKFGPFKFQGLFMRRQDEVADVYAGIIADDIVTISNIGSELMHGPSSDRTRLMIERSMAPAVDEAVGFAKPAVRAALGGKEYESIRDQVATEAVDYTITPLNDPDFNKQQSKAIRRLIAARMTEMPPEDFAEMLRTAMREDEWLLYLHGAVLGIGAGLIHLFIFGTAVEIPF